MKAKFLKIAGVKNEKQFYAKYPTESAFFKAHPEAKELKKAQVGSFIGGEQDVTPEVQSYQDYANLVPLSIVGKTQEQMREEQEKQAAAQAAQQGGGGLMGALQGLMGGLGAIGGGGGKTAYAPKAQFLSGPAPKIDFKPSALKLKNGKKIKKAQGGATAGILSGAGGQKPDIMGGIAQGLPLIGGIVDAIGSIGQMKKQRKELETSAKISDLALQASRTQPERTARRYVRPEDAITSPNERFIPGGTGTEILAEYGASIGGNPTEIQNMYNPGDIYSNLGYEPLSESDVVKQYRSGGAIPKGVGGLEQFMSGGGGQAVSSLIGAGFSQLGGGAAAGSQIGGALGQGLSMIPGVGAIVGPGLQVLGGAAGAIIDAKGAKQQKMNEDNLKGNVNAIAMQDSMRATLGNNSSFVRNGGNIPQAEVGWVSHDWQPQVITHFGEHSMEDLLKPPADADMLRTGGNIRQNNMSEMDQFNFGGNLKTHWGGRAEVDSYNPYLPGTGETVMFKGNQHSESDGKGNTGIGVSYGESDSYTDYAEYGTEQAVKKAKVEVENREPAIQLPEPSPYSPMQNFASGGQADNNNYSMTVFGALKINEHAANEIGDKQAKGRTFKTYIAEVNKKENEANNKLAKANEQLEDLKVVTPFDRLKLNSLQSTIQGENDKLKDYAVKKVTAAEVQNAYNETAEEYGIDADALAKGKIKQSKDMGSAKYGKEIEKAQKGKKKKASDTSVIKKLHDVIGITPDTPGYGTDLGLKSSIAYNNWAKDNFPEEYTSPEEMKKMNLDPRDIFYGKEVSSKESAKRFVDWLGYDTDHVRKLKQLLGITSSQPSTPLVLQSAQNAAPPPIDPRDPLGLNKILPIEEESYVKTPYSRKSYEQQLEQSIKGFEGDKKRRSVDGGFKADRFTDAVKSEPSTSEKKKGKTDWLDFAKIASTQLANILRKPLQEDLRGDQLYGEMLAKSQNQLQPVQAQTFQPLLDTPFDVSFQDKLNQNQASFNALQRQLGANPAALSALAAQKYSADSQVLADQFRTNQAMRAGVFSKNRDTLNEAALKNLAILDQQYVRQQEALSKTKATDLEIAKSISDKIAKNRLENRTFAAYSNLFPQYGFNRDMMTMVQNPTFFQDPVVGALAGNQLLTQLPGVKTKKKKKEEEEDDSAKFGKRLKKQLNNGSIVKSLKNI